jgi:hypothetical protein
MMQDGSLAHLSKTQRHEHARRLLGEVHYCQWRFLGSCRGPLEVAHVNGDDSDGRRENLRKLCQSHHALLDRGRMLALFPVQPAYHSTGRDRKRRYVNESPGQLPLLILVPDLPADPPG